MTTTSNSILKYRHYVVPIGIFSGGFIGLISQIGVAQAMLPAIISILFISVHEQQRYHPSQGTLCQKKVFVERTILIASAPLIYKLCLSLFLSKQPPNLSRNWWIMCITPGMVAAAVRPAITGEGETQQKYRNFKLCPFLQLLTESTEEHCQTLQNFMSMQYPVNSILALYVIFFIEDPRLEKLVEQLTKYLSTKEWQNMNLDQLELQISLNTISLCIQQKRKNRGEIKEEEMKEEMEKYTNITMPMLEQSLQDERHPLVHSNLITKLSNKHYDCVKQYVERVLSLYTLSFVSQESEAAVDQLILEFDIDVEELRFKQLPIKLQEITYEKFLSLPPLEQLIQLMTLEKHLESMDQDQQKAFWQNYCPKLRYQLLFLFYSTLSQNPIWLKLSDKELLTGAVNQELMLLLKHYTSEQLSLLIAPPTDDDYRINRKALIKWLYCNNDAIDPKHPLRGAVTINLVEDLANPEGYTPEFPEDVIKLVKTQQAEFLIQKREFWKRLPVTVYEDMKEKIGKKAFQELIQQLPPLQHLPDECF